MKLRSLWRKRKDVMEFNEKEKTSAVKQQALQALHDENVRLGLYDGVYAIDVLEQENRLLRARNERLEKELTKTINVEYRMMKTQQEQDEPVAYVNGDALDNMLDDRLAFIQRTKSGYRAIPLYTTPQQRTWVGLTLADKEEYLAVDLGGSRLDAMDWADNRLKKKNT